MATIKLQKKIIYTGTITLKTGLHIGGTNAALNIGGPDNFVIRNPISNKPYIPGSSLKGKMRSLLEIATGNLSSNSVSGRLFGYATPDEKRPSRLIVRDAELDVSNPEMFERTDMLYTESKTETSIDRITANSNPRTIERVPAGARFKLNMVLNIFEEEDEQELIKTLKKGIELLHDDYLGGHGSRGYGQVEIQLEEPEIKTY